MADILENIVADKRLEVAASRAAVPLKVMAQSAALAAAERKCLSMKGALASSRSGIIAEFKRRSPSKGWICQSGRPEAVVPAYAAAGASAVSILTDSKYFGGCPDYISFVRSRVPHTPLLRKDFIIDEYQLYEARAIGADAILLIAACLEREQCRTLAATAHILGLETLLEVHNERETEYFGENIDMLGVNNRHLGSFVTDVQTSFRLAGALPKGTPLISESGIGSPETVLSLREAGYCGFLIGETFMKTDDPGEALASFVESVEFTSDIGAGCLKG